MSTASASPSTAHLLRRCGGRIARVALGMAVFTGVMWPSVSIAADRKAPKRAYIAAARQLEALDIESAIETVDAALEEARADGLGEDPSLAPLLAMRGGLLFARDADKATVSSIFEQAAALDYNVRLPAELKSRDLEALLDRARQKARKPPEAVVHDTPSATVGRPLEFTALVNTPMPDGGTMVLYWRVAGTTGEFTATYMDVFGNFGSTVLEAKDHRNRGVDYFIYAFDTRQRAIANEGDRESPLTASIGSAQSAGAGGKTPPPPRGEERKRRPERQKRTGAKEASGLPRGFFNIGIGTGVGIARGPLEGSYALYRPGTDDGVYGTPEQACALERWYSGGTGIAPNGGTFEDHLAEIAGIDPAILPAEQDALVAAYDAAYCGLKQEVGAGIASAPLHLAPEFGIRVGRSLVVSVFARLQVLTGSKVFTEDRNKSLSDSYEEDVRSDDPPGVQAALVDPRFTFAVGAKVKYFIGRDSAKFRMFVGGFAGYGFARLRVPLAFANDRNGNSVSDDGEIALHGQRDTDGQVNPATCVPVWPYNSGCDPAGAGVDDRELANDVRGNARGDRRIDTVRLGPGFVGALFGVHYQIVRNFGIFGEFNLGAWFPTANTTGMLDINLGPVITF